MKILLFDVDGTLVNSGGAGRRSLDLALERIYGVKEGSKGVRLAGKTDTRNFFESLAQVLGRKPRKTEVEALIVAYLKALPGQVRKSVRQKLYKIVAGAPELMAALSRRDDVRIGLGTGNFERGASIKLRPSGLNRHFAFGGFGSDGHHRHLLLKRAVARARRTLNAAQRRALVPARDVVVIGDTALDVEAGKRAGYLTVAVATGWDSADDLKKAKPDLLLKDFRDVNRFIGFLERNDNGHRARERAPGTRLRA